MQDAKYDLGVNEFVNLIYTHLVSISLRLGGMGSSFSCGTVR
jgi:hypothetical protein